MVKRAGGRGDCCACHQTRSRWQIRVQDELAQCVTHPVPVLCPPICTAAVVSWSRPDDVMCVPMRVQIGDRQVNTRTYTAAFNLRGGAQEKMVGTMSGGERNRVHLAKVRLELTHVTGLGGGESTFRCCCSCLLSIMVVVYYQVSFSGILLVSTLSVRHPPRPHSSPSPCPY